MYIINVNAYALLSKEYIINKEKISYEYLLEIRNICKYMYACITHKKNKFCKMYYLINDSIHFLLMMKGI